MTDEQKRAIWIIAKWLLGSVSSEQLDRLDDHVASVANTNNADIGEELRRAMGYETDD